MIAKNSKGILGSIDDILLRVSMFKDRDTMDNTDFCDKYGHQEPIWTTFDPETGDTYGHCTYCSREIARYACDNDNTRPVKLEPSARRDYVPIHACAE